MDAAVGVDVDHAGLVVLGRGERDPEFDRGQREPALDHPAVGIVLADRLTAAPVVGAALKLGHDLVDDVVLDLLVVGRDVALGLAIEVELADLERVLAQRVGDLLDQSPSATMPWGPLPRNAVLETVLVLSGSERRWTLSK